MFKGTKGPWYPVEYAGKFVIQTENHYSANNDILESNDFSYEEAKANILLISKAPEILDMLESFVRMFAKGQILHVDKVVEKRKEIEQLIKSATGESNFR